MPHMEKVDSQLLFNGAADTLIGEPPPSPSPSPSPPPPTLAPRTRAPSPITRPPPTELPSTPAPPPSTRRPTTSTSTSPPTTRAPSSTVTPPPTPPPPFEAPPLPPPIVTPVSIPETLNSSNASIVSSTQVSNPSELQTTVAPVAATNANANASTIVSINVNAETGSRATNASLDDQLEGNQRSANGLSTGSIGGIAAASVAVIGLVVWLLFWFYRRKNESKQRRSSHCVQSMDASGSIAIESYTLSPDQELNNYDQTLDLASTHELVQNYLTTSKPSLWDDEILIAARIPLEKLVQQELLSVGGHGAVYYGTYRHEKVAIKVLLPEKRTEMRAITTFLAEIKLMASIQHPCIVRFIGVAWEARTDLCAVSEFMAGGDLFTLLRRFDRMEGRKRGFDLEKATIALHVAHALTYLHSLDPIVVHRDLKSMNILLSEHLEAKVTDFGVSRKYTVETMTAGVGTRRWMAPEVMMGKRYDASADIFSFGIVLSELETHQPPYSDAFVSKGRDSRDRMTETTLMELVARGRVRINFSPNAPTALVELGYACVQLDPRARPRASEVHFQLQKILHKYQNRRNGYHNFNSLTVKTQMMTNPSRLDPFRNSMATTNAADSNVPTMMMYPKPVTVLIIGMAGSGKTTLMQRLTAYSVDAGLRHYVMNLDPAVHKTGYTANIDIRDTVDYKQVMKEYGLGPNGAIMTSLNLFATRFDQVIDLLSKRNTDLDYAIVDTPGQIEAFTWSASGQIITESLASTFPSVIAYVVDTPRTSSPSTFMSNMLYACSILFKLKLPFVVVFNKIDVLRHEFALEWMTDFEAFQKALDDVQDESYMGSLSRSLSLVLEEFYNTLTSVGVSAATGEGMAEFFAAIDQAAEEYEKEYLPELLERVKQQEKKKQERQDTTLANVMQDMDISKDQERNTAGERTDL